MEGFDFVGFEYPPEDVVDVIIREKPDIILSCVMMPHMDGLTLIQRLKQNDKTKNVPFVFFTNLHQEEDIRRGLALGAIEYLCKAETKPAEVVKKISSLLHS
jgi:CheY-like chemotaxis protein